MLKTILSGSLLLLFSCSDIFLPPTGTPLGSSFKRASPEGVVDQLIGAYTSRRIDLIEDLLADSFQFYVAPAFYDYYEQKYSYYDPEAWDTSMAFVSTALSKPYFYYWKRKDELERTKKIFTNTLSSEFRYPPIISGLVYTISSNNDTVQAELRLSYGVLYLVLNGREDEYVDVDNQVFLLRKDNDGLWVIRKWYDLSSETN
jgi:hypothetical protein